MIPADPLSEPVAGQLSQAKSDVYAAERKGLYSNVEIKRDFPIKDVAGNLRLLCAALVYVHGQTGPVDSYVCLTSWNNRFVKFRLTATRHDGSEAEARLFLDAWIKVL